MWDPVIDRADSNKSSKIGKIGWSLYQQVAAVLGAFSLAVAVGRLVGLDWHSALGTLVAFWGEYVRPVAKWVLESPIGTPFRWAFGWKANIPEIAQDYVAVGLTYTLSWVRYLRAWSADEGTGPIGRWRRMAFPSALRATLALILMLVLFTPVLAVAAAFGIVAWPLIVGFDLVQQTRILIKAVRSERGSRWRERLREEARDGLVIYAPFIYLAALLAVNFWVLPHLS